MYYNFLIDLHIHCKVSKNYYLSLLASFNNNNNNKLYLHDHNKVLQYCKSYLKLLIDSL